MRSTEDTELLESLQQLPVVLAGLGEAEPWINDQLAPAGTPALSAASSWTRSSAMTSDTTSWYDALLCMSSAWPRQCMQTYGMPDSGDQAEQSGDRPCRRRRR